MKGHNKVLTWQSVVSKKMIQNDMRTDIKMLSIFCHHYHILPSLLEILVCLTNMEMNMLYYFLRGREGNPQRKLTTTIITPVLFQFITSTCKTHLCINVQYISEKEKQNLGDFSKL